MQNRTVFFQKTIYYITYLIFVMTTIAGWFGVAPGGDTAIRIRPLQTEQEITGWGTSACWWAQMVDDANTAEEYAKLLYSDEGLGLNVYRYNIGGGEAEHPEPRWHNGVRARLTESFLNADVYAETGKLTYDWSKDANAQRILFNSLEYGNIDTVVLFANSPHYLMTKSGHATGSLEDNTDNLKEECYEDFANYMLDIADYFISKGVPVKYISPINEPEWSWGGGWVGQEGCHYDFDTAIEVVKVFAKVIKERNSSVKLSVLESGQLSLNEDAHYNLKALETLYADEEIRSVLGTYSYHSYWTDRDFLLKSAYGRYLEANYPDLEIEMSEWCELPNSHKMNDAQAAVIMARTIGEDITMSGVNSWTSWVAVNGGGENADSMIGADGENYNRYIIGKRYYAMAHYSKFVPVGSHVVDFGLSVADTKSEKAWWTQKFEGDEEEYPVYLTENNMTVSAFVTPEDDYVVVIVNEGAEKDITFPGMMLRDMSVYTTDADSNLELTAEEEIGMKKITVGTGTVTTVVLSK